MRYLTGVVGRVLAFARVVRNSAQTSDVQLDPGGGPNITGQHFAPPGDDAFPLSTDYAYSAPTPQAGRFATLGYIDPKNAPVAQAGEKRIYARKADGTVAVQLWLKSDASAILSNALGRIELKANGDIVFNDVITIKANGDVILANSLLLAGKQIAGHQHPQGPDSDGNTEQNTGGNL